MRVSRRSLLLGAGAVLVSACSNEPEPVVSTGPWEFTDDRGVKIRRPSRPAKVVAQVTAAAALWDLGIRPIGIFGETKGPDGKPNTLAGSVDLTQVTSVGDKYGEFSVEKFASLQPDLLVAPMQVANELWYVPKEQVSAIEVSEVTATKGGVKVLFISSGPEGVYFANPPAFSDLSLLQSLGARFVTPKVNPAEPHFEHVSWELADKYPADVILYDTRNAAPFTTERAKYATVAKLPAVQANQAFGWNPETPTSWAQFAPALRQLAVDLGRVRPITG